MWFASRELESKLGLSCDELEGRSSDISRWIDEFIREDSSKPKDASEHSPASDDLSSATLDEQREDVNSCNYDDASGVPSNDNEISENKYEINKPSKASQDETRHSLQVHQNCTASDNSNSAIIQSKTTLPANDIAAFGKSTSGE